MGPFPSASQLSATKCWFVLTTCMTKSRIPILSHWLSVLQDKHAHLRINGYVDDVMKQLMELLDLEIPKWEGPTICESSAPSDTSADVKPPHNVSAKAEVKRDIIKQERKREATELVEDGSAKEETISIKKERADLTVETEEK